MTVSAVCPPRLALSRSQRKRERNSSSDCWISHSHSEYRQPRMSPLISRAVAATRQPVGSLPQPAPFGSKIALTDARICSPLPSHTCPHPPSKQTLTSDKPAPST